MRTIIVLSCLLLVPFIAGFAGDSTGFEARRMRLIDVVSEEQEKSVFSVAARFQTGRDLARACAMLDSLTEDHSIGGMFYAYSMIGTYLRFREIIPDSIRKKIREAYRVRTMYRGDTENHWAMYYAGIYLAAQTWPGEDGSRWFNGRSSDENFREAKEWLDYWMKTTATIGQGEFDSPTYMTVFLSPLLQLYDFALDPLMKRKAHMMLDLLFVDFAAEHLKGNYGGGHSRDYPDDIVNPLAAPATMWAWLFFGEPQFELWSEARYRPRHRGSWETMWGALSSYRLPDVIRTIATDRSVPYVHTETKRVRNIIRFDNVKNPPVYKYTFMAHDYVLGSLQGGILQPIQQHTWDVTFVSGKPNNTLFTLHPFYSGKELAMFFPEEQKFLAGEVDRYHLVYTNPDKWNSSSPYEQTFQCRGTLLLLYHIAHGANHPHIDGFFPKTLDKRIVDSTGWIFCQAGTVYIGFYPLRPYEWIEEPVNWRWRSHVLNNGIVVEVSDEAESGSFEAFTGSLKLQRPVLSDRHPTLQLSYTARSGDRMEFTFGGARMLNGTPVDVTTYKLFNGPFVQSDVGSGVITLTAGGKKRVLDFNNFTIMEQ